MSDSFVRAVRRTGQFVRDAWLLVGAVLLILVMMELGYRGQAGLRSALHSGRGSAAVGSPYSDSGWYAAYDREYTQTFHEHWKPFVYFRRGAFSGSLINVDSSGHRRTVGGPAPAGAADTVHIFFFGGSTMWGTNLRDNATIASIASQELARVVPAGTAVQVTNFGESGYVFTQELIELELQLRAGRIPDVVLFYDGMCDMTAAAQYGSAGVSQNESNRSREFEFGRAVSGTETGVGSDVRAAGAIGNEILRRVQFIQRLFAIVARPAVAQRSTEWLARDVVSVYAGNAEIIEALGKVYGFRVMYVWQPTLYSTAKKATPFEQSLLSAAELNPLHVLLRAMNKTTVPVLDSTMKARVSARFVDETSLFAGDTISVFTDQLGHTTEKAVLPIVAQFFPTLRTLVDSARASRAHERAAPGRAAAKGGAAQN